MNSKFKTEVKSLVTAIIALWLATIVLMFVALAPAKADEIADVINDNAVDICTLSVVTCDDEWSEGDKKEIEWLAKAIYFEARNQSIEGQIAVAKVILNRVDDPRWPKTVQAVVRQGEEKPFACQFSFMCNGLKEVIANQGAWDLATLLAENIYSAWKDKEDMGKAHSYRANYTKNKKALEWFAKFEQKAAIGTHLFYGDKG